MSAADDHTNRLVWVTDPHLDFVSLAEASDFCAAVAAERSDAVLVGGDVAEAPNVEFYLKMMEGTWECPSYFVLGNHDLYRGSIRQARARGAELARPAYRIQW